VHRCGSLEPGVLYGVLSFEKRVSRLMRKIEPFTRGSAWTAGETRVASSAPSATTSSFAGSRRPSS
jgi:hypothetical protein